MKTLLALLLLSVSAFAVSSYTVNMVCDPADPDDGVVSYVIYEQSQTNPAIWTQVGTSLTNNFTLTGVLSGKHTYAVTAKNLVDESDRSNSVVANTQKPKPPKNSRVFTITIVP